MRGVGPAMEKGTRLPGKVSSAGRIVIRRYSFVQDAILSRAQASVRARRRRPMAAITAGAKMASAEISNSVNDSGRVKNTE